jgi:hypothetical protein
MQPSPSAETLMPELPSGRKGIDAIYVFRWVVRFIYFERLVSGLERKRKQHTGSLILCACDAHRWSTRHRTPKPWKRLRRRDYNE